MEGLPPAELPGCSNMAGPLAGLTWRGPWLVSRGGAPWLVSHGGASWLVSHGGAPWLVSRGGAPGLFYGAIETHQLCRMCPESKHSSLPTATAALHPGVTSPGYCNGFLKCPPCLCIPSPPGSRRDHERGGIKSGHIAFLLQALNGSHLTQSKSQTPSCKTQVI